MKHYTDTIPLSLAEKLKEKGMPMEEDGKSIIDWKVPTYAATIDWLMSERGLHIIVEPYWDFAEEVIDTTYEWSVVKSGTIHADTPYSHCDTWHEAADAAIEKALTLI